MTTDTSLTLTQDGKVLTETVDGITMPADYSFATVNDYVHGIERHFEELQYLCLGMANEIERLSSIKPERAALSTETAEKLLALVEQAQNHQAPGFEVRVYRAATNLPVTTKTELSKHIDKPDHP